MDLGSCGHWHPTFDLLGGLLTRTRAWAAWAWGGIVVAQHQTQPAGFGGCRTVGTKSHASSSGLGVFKDDMRTKYSILRATLQDWGYYGVLPLNLFIRLACPCTMITPFLFIHFPSSSRTRVIQRTCRRVVLVELAVGNLPEK